MKLLILGAGGHGQVVKEVAEAICDEAGSIYEKIDFLDDNASEAIGTIAELKKWCRAYDDVFVGVGNNAFRRQLIGQIREMGGHIPVLIHPTAYVSKTACIKAGTVVEPRAIVNANTVVGEGCIISVGAIVDHDVVVEACAHVNAGVICKAGSRIEAERKLETGEVVIGYKSM